MKDSGYCCEGGFGFSSGARRTLTLDAGRCLDSAVLVMCLLLWISEAVLYIVFLEYLGGCLLDHSDTLPQFVSRPPLIFFGMVRCRQRV